MPSTEYKNFKYFAGIVLIVLIGILMDKANFPDWPEVSISAISTLVIAFLTVLIENLPNLLSLFAVMVSGMSVWLASKNIEKQIKSAEDTARENRMADFYKVWTFELQNEISEFLMLCYQNQAAFEDSQQRVQGHGYPNNQKEQKIQADREISFHKIILRLDSTDHLQKELLASIDTLQTAKTSEWMDARDNVVTKAQLVFNKRVKDSTI